MAEPAPSSLPVRVSRELDLLGEIGQTIGVLQGGWRVIGISALICLIISIIYLARTKRIYQAEVRLLVLQQGGRPLNVANTDPSRLLEGTEDYIPTHSLILSSPLVIKRAIDKVGIENLPSLDVKKEGGDPVEAVIKHLKVTRPDRLAKVLRVGYRAGDRDEAVRTIEAIIDSYQQFLEETFQKNSSTAITLISKARNDLSRELRELEAKYLELRRKNPVLITGEGGSSTFLANRLANWDRASSEAMVKAVQLKAQLELGRRLAREGTELWATAHAISQLGGDTSSLMAALASGVSQAGATEYIRQLSQEQQQLSERFGPQYSKVRELQAQIDRIRGRARGARSRLEGDEVRDLLNAIDQSLQSVQAMRSDLGKQFDQEQEKAKQFEEDLLAEADLRGKLERQRALFSTVVDQLKQAQFVSDYSSISAQVIEPAKTPRSPVWPKVSLTLTLALVVGCAVGMGVVVVSDRLDQRVRSLDELRQLTGLAVLGQVAFVPEDQSAAMGPVGLISHAKPRSYWAEAYRAIRTNIDFLRRRNPRLQVLLVTSIYPGDGKTTSASNLAISLALAGRRVLLIDADLRRPSLDKVHGLGRDHGLSRLLKDPLLLDRAVQQSTIENLEVITTGPEVPNPAELLSSPRLACLLDEARQAYDVILIDAPPLLIVADPAIVGAVVDGVILVARPKTLRRRDAEHALELLRSLGTSLLGMLINGVGHEDRGYGHRYGYGYDHYGRSTERRPGDATSPIGAGDQAPEAVGRANGQPGNGQHKDPD